MNTLMDAVKADRAAKQPHEDPFYKLEQIIDSIDSTRRDTEAILNLPAPIKTAADKLLEDSSTADSGDKKKEGDKKTAPDGDAEMKNEEPKAKEAK